MFFKRKKKKNKAREQLGRNSGSIAKERLRFMMDANRQKLDEDTLRLIRQEIGSIITKYVDIDPENVEVKVMLKDYKAKIV